MSKGHASRIRLFIMLFTVAVLLVGAIPQTLVSAGGSSPPTVAPAPNRRASEAAGARARAAYGNLPMRFERNQGQFDRRVRFAARGAGYALWLTADEAVLSLSSGERRTPDNEAQTAVIRMKLLNASRATSVTGEAEIAGRSHYFIGNDPAKWQAGVSNYARVTYRGVYRGIDMVYYGNGRELEYDFKLAAGANPAAIAWRITGAERLRVDRSGELVMATAAGELRQHRPVAYQEINGERRAVRARYVLRGAGRVGFALGSYDRSKPLVIDPVLSYSTYLGGSGGDGGDEGHAIAVDAAGNAYVAGLTFSSDFPTVPPAQSRNARYGDLFVTKLNPSGSALIFSTYLGGNDTDYVNGIAVDPAGKVYVVGWTYSGDFPTVNPLQPARHGPLDAFVAKLTASGAALDYSTYLGGQGIDEAQSVAADAAGFCYVVGRTFSADFPVSNALQTERKGRSDAFVAKINPAGTAFSYSTYLGGIGTENKAAVAVDTFGNAYVAGSTLSPDFPTANAFQPAFKGKTAFKTLDGGSNWAAINNGLPVHVGVAAFAIDPQTPATMYAASEGIYKSTDGGNTWSAASTGLFSNTIGNGLAINPATPSTLFAAMTSGLYRSTDSGGTWNGNFDGPAFSMAIDPINPANVYAGRRNAISKSTDGGNSWGRIQVYDVNYFSYRPGSVKALAVDPVSPSTLYLAGDDARFVYKSTDGGLTWQVKSTGLRFSTIYTLKIDPTNPATLYAGTSSGFYKSANRAESWSRIGGERSPAAQALAIDPTATTTIYAGTSGTGVSKSTDGGNSWVAARNGLRNSFVNALAISPQSSFTIYAGNAPVTDGFIAKLNASGSAFIYSTYLGGDDPDYCAAVAVDEASNVYVTGETSSADFPTAHPLRSFSGQFPDVFVSKLNSTGTGLIYSTYLGGDGDDLAGGIAVDSAGNAYVIGTTYSTNFPLAAPLKSSLAEYDSDAFVTKLNPDGTDLVYSTYFGGGRSSPYMYGDDAGLGIAVTGAGVAYVTGYTYSSIFPTTPGAFQPTPRGAGYTAFVARLTTYNVCLQDESNGNLLQFDSTNGAYQFTTCGGLTLTGTATLTQRGCMVTLQDMRGDRRLLASYDSCAHRATASVQVLSRGTTLTITDRNTLNNTCACSR